MAGAVAIVTGRGPVPAEGRREATGTAFGMVFKCRDDIDAFCLTLASGSSELEDEASSSEDSSLDEAVAGIFRKGALGAIFDWLDLIGG